MLLLIEFQISGLITEDFRSCFIQDCEVDSLCCALINLLTLLTATNDKMLKKLESMMQDDDPLKSTSACTLYIGFLLSETDIDESESRIFAILLSNFKRYLLHYK